MGINHILYITNNSRNFLPTALHDFVVRGHKRDSL